MCSAAVCSQEEIISTSTCARSTTAVVTNSSRARLRHSPCLISQIMRQLDRHPRHRHRCRHETCFSIHTTWSITSEGLRHVSSSTQVGLLPRLCSTLVTAVDGTGTMISSVVRIVVYISESMVTDTVASRFPPPFPALLKSSVCSALPRCTTAYGGTETYLCSLSSRRMRPSWPDSIVSQSKN